jgi:tetratricopeptide (TPR) repeat protein
MRSPIRRRRSRPRPDRAATCPLDEGRRSWSRNAPRIAGVAAGILRFALAFPAQTAPSPPAVVNFITIDAAADTTAVLLPPAETATVLMLQDPPRWAVDLRPARLKTHVGGRLWEGAPRLGGLEAVRLGQFRAEPDPVVRVTLVLKDDRPLAIARTPAGWRLTMPAMPGDSVGTGRFPKASEAASGAAAEAEDPQVPAAGIDVATEVAPAAGIDSAAAVDESAAPGTSSPVGRLLVTAQEAVIDGRPDRAMEALTLGLRLYGGAEGTGAMRLLWHIMVPLTSRPAAVSLFAAGDAAEAAWIAEGTYGALAGVALGQESLAGTERVLRAWKAGHRPAETWAGSAMDLIDLQILRGHAAGAAEWIAFIPRDGLGTAETDRLLRLEAELRIAEGNPRAAEEILTSVMSTAREPSAAAARLRLADLLHDRGAFQDALDLYEEGMEAGGGTEDRSWATYRAGVCKEELGDWSGAAATFNALLEAAPRSRWSDLARRHLSLLAMASPDAGATP